MTPRVVLVAPDPATQRRVQMALGQHGFLVAAASTPRDALRMVEMESPTALVVDARHAEERAFATEHAGTATPIIGLVDSDDADTVRALLDGGVADVVPLTLLEPMLPRRLDTYVRRAQRGRGRRGTRKGDMLVGHSEAIVEAMGRLEMIAKSDMGAAIFGETGTGKELVARAIHARSRRADKPLVVANCTAIPEQLFENELFGHERGAFTGAETRNQGLLAEAEGGTLLLDEIGDIAPSVQAKLLRLLQFREYKMVGGTKTLRADVRIITSTHRDLAAAVSAGTFREDLFYRLNMLHMVLPPLRARLDDIPLLVDHFVRLHNEREGLRHEGFTASAIRMMQRHDWPGNVRELEGVVYRSLVMAGDERRLDEEAVDIHRVQRTRQPAASLDMSRPFAELKAAVIERFERSYLEQILTKTQGNLSQAAREAQHERKSLWRLLNKHGIDPKQFSGKMP